MLATKVWGRMHPGPNGAGLSRKAILSEIDKSLKRLGTDYVDLYIIHRWDYNTPIEETMEALHEVVKSGKARYIGASAMYAWQFQKAQHIAEKHRWTRKNRMSHILWWGRSNIGEDQKKEPVNDPGSFCLLYRGRHHVIITARLSVLDKRT